MEGIKIPFGDHCIVLRGVICFLNESIDLIIYEMKLDAVFLWIQGLERGIYRADKLLDVI